MYFPFLLVNFKKYISFERSLKPKLNLSLP